MHLKKIILFKIKIMNLISHKQNKKEKKANDHTKYQFIIAVMNLDEILLSKLLSKDSIYMGRYNYWQILHWFRNKFSKLNNDMFHSKFIENISIDAYPGSIAFEFSFAPYSIDENTDPFGIEINDEIFKNEKAITFTLVLLFDNGKIIDIRMPKKIMSLDNLNSVKYLN
jgi:hypothetical protein